LLEENRLTLDELASILEEKEILSRKEVKAIVKKSLA